MRRSSGATDSRVTLMRSGVCAGSLEDAVDATVAGDRERLAEGGGEEPVDALERGARAVAPASGESELGTDEIAEEHGDDVRVPAAFERHGPSYAAQAGFPAGRGGVHGFLTLATVQMARSPRGGLN